jgi:predicted RecB family nuclease
MSDSEESASLIEAVPRLSKSKYIAGLQCLKRLYLAVHRPQLATPADPATQAILDMGHEVGAVARRRFPGGVLVEAGYRQREAALARTAELLADPTVPAIFEAAFLHDGVLVRADVLERRPSPGHESGRWRLIEVKSSTKIKDVHLDDLAIQSHVLLEAGLELDAVCLMHVHTGYEYHDGDLDLDRLFLLHDVTESVREKRAQVGQRLALMKQTLAQPEPPPIEPGSRCQTPYECPFWAHCTAHKPPRWIHRLPGSKQQVEKWAEQGITLIDDVPDEALLSLVQRRMKRNVEWISPMLVKELQSVTYPVHHLDFETVMLPVPRFSSTRPYQAIPVQWSDHIEQESGELAHHEYLHDSATEPRRRWADALIESLGERGTICVYSAYERAVLEQLAEAFPEYRSAIARMIKRLWDLFPIIRDHYYHPAFQGSYSIKSVLPAVVPSLGYADLSIRDGGQAASEFYRMIFVETDWVERATIKEALLRYCERDTLAMVELRRALKQKATTHNGAGTSMQIDHRSDGQTNTG